jgi:hypothetical protein
VFAVVTRSRLRSARHFPKVLGATLAVRRELRGARGLLRAANVIAGPTEFLTVTIWADRDAMRAFMGSGTHELVMWTWPRWLSAFWLARMAATPEEVGTWRGLSIARLRDRGGPPHSEFVPPGFASREPRHRDLERHGVRATIMVVQPRTPLAWHGAVSALRRAPPGATVSRDVIRAARGYGLDGELVSLVLWRDERSAREQLRRAARLTSAGVPTWCMTWRPLDELGTWDGERLRHVVAAAG